MDVIITITAKVSIGEAELGALRKASPENQLATARLLSGNVTSTVRQPTPPKPKAKK